LSGNGGGFVFDCRALPNPGRYAEYVHLTGLDTSVQDYLAKYDEVESIYRTRLQYGEKCSGCLLSAGLQNLMVNFGCTGGRHRSVYCAEKLAQRLALIEGIEIHDPAS
jgi:RNase adapter protein RapZ